MKPCFSSLTKELTDIKRKERRAYVNCELDKMNKNIEANNKIVHSILKTCYDLRAYIYIYIYIYIYV